MSESEIQSACDALFDSPHLENTDVVLTHVRFVHSPVNTVIDTLKSVNEEHVEARKPDPVPCTEYQTPSFPSDKKEQSVTDSTSWVAPSVDPTTTVPL